MLTLPIPRRSPHPAAGFSLVEIMVGMVIGMFGIIVMMQVFALTEEQKRATTSGSDANGNGAIAMYGLQREILQAGYGFSDASVIGCNVTLRAGVTLNAIAPVTINHASIPAGDANTDTLLVVYGNSNDATQGDGITGTSITANSYPVETPTSFQGRDNVLAIPNPAVAPCVATMSRVTAAYVGTILDRSVPMTTAVTSMPTTGGRLFNLGQSPKALAYAIRNGNLTVCRYVDINPATGVDSGNDCSDGSQTGNATVWVPIASNIVSLRAQYGSDTTVPLPAPPPNFPRYMPIVNTFDQATPVTSCGWSRTPAVRLVLVARSGQFEKTAVTAAAPVWAGSAGAAIDLSANADWQNFRYKLFENMVAIRNVGWQGVNSSC